MKHIVVIGGGPGGYVAAIRAAQLGAEVTLVESGDIGGTCLNRGCMPTKALLHAADARADASAAASMGIVCGDITVDWKKVQSFRASVVAKLTGGVRALCKANKIKVVNGAAVFTGPKTLKAGNDSLTADSIIIATGSYPIMPPIPGLKESRACIDSTACLELDHIPESLLIIGGGVIGLELGSAYAKFGSKVTVIEMLDRLLPLMDGELTKIVQTQLTGAGLDIHTESRVLSVEDTARGAKVKVQCPKGEQTFEAEKVLVCVGRAPNTAELQLDKAGVRTEKGFITVTDAMETNVPGVYAVGDCNGKLMLAHAAMAMGEVAAENAMGANREFHASESPSCAYIGPEFGGVGCTEEQLKEQGIEYKVGKFPTSANGRSLVMGHTDGMVKVLAGKKYGEILGVHILAPCANELISQAALALKTEATLDELADMIYCHPTVSESVHEAVLAADKKAIHIPNRK